jgi:hypothetical protein
MDVASWLRNLGLEHYEAAFRENDVGAEECLLAAVTRSSCPGTVVMAG